MSSDIERVIQRDLDQLPLLPADRWIPTRPPRMGMGARVLRLAAAGVVVVAAVVAGNALARVRSDNAPTSGTPGSTAVGCATTPITDWNPTNFLWPRPTQLVVGGSLGAAPNSLFSADHYWYLRNTEPRPSITLRAERLDAPAQPVLIFAVGYPQGDGFPPEWARGNWYYRTSAVLSPPDVGCWRVALEDDPQSAVVYAVKLQDRRANEPTSRQGATGVCAAARARVLAGGSIVRRADRIESKRVSAADLQRALGFPLPGGDAPGAVAVCVVAVSGEVRQTTGVIDADPSRWGLFAFLAATEVPLGTQGGRGDLPAGFGALTNLPINELSGTVTEVVGANTVGVALDFPTLGAEFGNPVLLQADRFTEITPPAPTIAASGVKVGDRVAVFFERPGLAGGGVYPLSIFRITARSQSAQPTPFVSPSPSVPPAVSLIPGTPPPGTFAGLLYNEPVKAADGWHLTGTVTGGPAPLYSVRIDIGFPDGSQISTLVARELSPGQVVAFELITARADIKDWSPRVRWIVR